MNGRDRKLGLDRPISRRPTGGVLVYDGECAFCQYTVDYAAAVTGGRLRFRPFQDAAGDYPEVALEDFQASIQLFTPDGRFSGADAALRVLAMQPRLAFWHWCYRFVPLFGWFAEFLYGVTSRHRASAMRLSRVAFGRTLRPLEYALTASIISRATGVILLIAFVSWAVQADGLVGGDGILPLGAFFEGARAQLGPAAYYLLPSAYWWAPGQTTTLALVGIGIIASVGLVVSRFTVVSALTAYLAYLSLFIGGQVFMAYQWDILLLECALLVVIVNLHTRAGIWLFRLLVFRFMFLSGAVKLLSGDPSWADFSALGFHFETQPLPNALAWYAHHLPDALLRFAVAATFVIELLLPVLIFMPRNLRLIAAVGFIGLESLIFATGNYNFFNLLTIVMCLALLDDRVFGRRQPRYRCHGRTERSRASRRGWAVLVAAFVLLNAIQLHAAFAGGRLPGWERALLTLQQPFYLVNGYGLFAVMTTRRDELIVQGSADGESWWDYQFRYKPQALDALPAWAAPHQPRLDWQMWFAALRPVARVYWIDNFVTRLLQGSPSVTGLLRDCCEATPRYVRIVRYRYRFSAPLQQAESGNWWTRDSPEIWYPATALAVPKLPEGLLEIP